MTPAQPGLEVSAPGTYREKLFNLVAGRDPIEVLGETASALADIVAGHPAEVLRGRAIPRKWTPNEIIGHLTDSEWVYGYRLRLILCEDEPFWASGRTLGSPPSATMNASRPNLRKYFGRCAYSIYLCGDESHQRTCSAAGSTMSVARSLCP
jgi:hypothetical protein